MSMHLYSAVARRCRARRPRSIDRSPCTEGTSQRRYTQQPSSLTDNLLQYVIKSGNNNEMNHLTRCGKLGRPIALAFGHRKVKLGLHDACHRLCVGIDRLQTGTLGDYNDSIQRRWNLSVHSYRERADIEEEEPKAGSVPEDLQRREATGGKDADKIQPKRLGKRKVAIFLGYEVSGCTL